jgi:hypothetical protein
MLALFFQVGITTQFLSRANITLWLLPVNEGFTVVKISNAAFFNPKMRYQHLR